MLLGYWRQFDDFNPKEGNVPGIPFSTLPDIAHRARSLLQKRTKEEIRAAALLIDGMIEDSFIRDQMDNDGWAKKYLLEAQANGEDLSEYVKSSLPYIAGRDPHYYAGKENTTQVAVLKACIDNDNIESEDFPNATQSECFAVLALWLVADCVYWLQNKSGDSTASSSDYRIQYAFGSDYAIWAMDAVSHAEYLLEIEQNDSRSDSVTEKMIGSKKWRKQNAANAANARHDKPGGSRFKREAIRRIWASGKYDTRDRCAEEEYAGLDMSYATARKALINTPDPKSCSG